MRATAIVLSLAALVVVGACDSFSPTAPANGDLEVSPSTAAIAAGGSVQLTVIGSDGITITEGITWRSAARHVVDISASGLATAMYGDGTVSIRAFVGAASGESKVTVLSACASPVPLEGSPPPQPTSAQAFEVRYAEGTNAAERTRELAQRLGFTVTETTANGFIATLTPQQVNSLRCVADVAGMTYV